MKGSFDDRLFDPLIQPGQYRLAAIIERSQLTPKSNDELVSLCQNRLWPLLQQREFSNLRMIGPCLAAPRDSATPQNQSDFFQYLSRLGGDAVCGWIVSSLPAAGLADHLAQANSVLAPDGQRYLLRYHTEKALRTLYGRMDLPDISEWVAPILNWWVPTPHAERVAWGCLKGHNRPAVRRVNGLKLDQACWDALAEDPLSHRLAEQLKQSMAVAGLPERCHVVRLGLAQKYLAQARQAGFVHQADLITYVTIKTLEGNQLTSTPAWQAAIDSALSQSQALSESLQRHLNRQP